jgi:hypothetical protein
MELLAPVALFAPAALFALVALSVLAFMSVELAELVELLGVVESDLQPPGANVKRAANATKKKRLRLILSSFPKGTHAGRERAFPVVCSVRTFFYDRARPANDAAMHRMIAPIAARRKLTLVVWITVVVWTMAISDMKFGLHECALAGRRGRPPRRGLGAFDELR